MLRNHLWRIALALLVALVSLTGQAATITITANTNWSAITTGTGGGGQPGPADTIIVKNSRTLTVNVAAGTVGAITLGGGNPSGGPGTLSFNSGSAVTITNASGQSGLLVLGGGGNAGNLTMQNGGTLTLRGFTSTTVGTFNSGSGTIVLTGNNTLPSAAAYATYNNLSVTANTTTLGQNTTVAGNLSISGASALATGTLNMTSRALTVTGTTTVAAFGILSNTSSTGNKTFNAFTIDSGGTWNSIAAGNVFFQGSFTNNGTFTAGLAVYSFSGTTGTQAFTGTNGGSTSFGFLTINNANGVSLTGTHDLTVSTLLTLSTGKITTGTNVVYVSNGSNITGATTGRFIEGNLKKPFDSGNLSRTFEVGGNSGTNYAPVTLTFASVTSAGQATVSTTSGTHPQIASAGLDNTTPSLLNRYWTITNNSVGFTSYSATFTYASTELDAAVTPATLIAVRYASGTWNPTTLSGTPTSTSLGITSEAGFGDFAIGNTAAASGTIGRFNAYDPPPVTPSGSITGNIRTKIAGTQFTLTIVHLNNKGTGLQNLNDNITVDLLDGSPTGGTFTNNCASNWTTVIATVAGNMTGGVSSTTVNLTVNDAYPDVRVKVTRAGGGEIGCSTDNFAIRPSALNIVATDGDWQSAGTTRTLDTAGGRVHAASTPGATTPRPFTLTITAVNSASATTGNYSGTATLKAGSPNCTGTCVTTGTLSPASFTLAGGTLSIDAHYSEAGNFTLEIEDATFSSVDAADTAAAVRTVPQGGTPPLSIGRFVPDRFEFSSPTTPQLATFGNACTSRSFTYVGQPFWFATGLAPSATLNAVNAGGGVTTNYVLGAGKPTISETFADASVPAGAPLNTIGVGAAPTLSGNGTATYSPTSGTLSYTRNATTPVVPFNAAITLSVTASDISEQATTGNGVISTASALLFNGGGAGIAFDSGNELRYGQLRLLDVFGPLTGNASGNAPVAIQAQYWQNATAGFVTNTADNCSTFIEKNFVLDSHRGAITALNLPTPTSGSNGKVSMGAGTLVSGIGQVNVVSPTIAITSPGNVRICLDLDPSSSPVDNSCVAPTPADKAYLQGRWADTGNYDRDPSARVGFGVYGAQPRNFIFLRENY